MSNFVTVDSNSISDTVKVTRKTYFELIDENGQRLFDLRFENGQLFVFTLNTAVVKPRGRNAIIVENEPR